MKTIGDLPKKLKRFIVNGKVNKMACYQYMIDHMVHHEGYYAETDRDALVNHFLNDWIQPPKFVEVEHPELKVSKDYNIPYGLNAHEMEALIAVTFALKNNHEVYRNIIADFITLNPELLDSELRFDIDLLKGLTSAINIDDIKAFQSEGSMYLRSEAFKIRCRYAEWHLGVSIQWVLSEKTLKKIEKYLDDRKTK